MLPFPCRFLVFPSRLKENDWYEGKGKPGMGTVEASLTPASFDLFIQPVKEFLALSPVSQGSEECVEIERKHNQRKKGKRVRIRQTNMASSKALFSCREAGIDPLQDNNSLYHYFSLFKMEKSGVSIRGGPESLIFTAQSQYDELDSSMIPKAMVLPNESTWTQLT